MRTINTPANNLEAANAELRHQVRSLLAQQAALTSQLRRALANLLEEYERGYHQGYHDGVFRISDMKPAAFWRPKE